MEFLYGSSATEDSTWVSLFAKSFAEAVGRPPDPREAPPSPFPVRSNLPAPKASALGEMSGSSLVFSLKTEHVKSKSSFKW